MRSIAKYQHLVMTDFACRLQKTSSTGRAESPAEQDRPGQHMNSAKSLGTLVNSAVSFAACPRRFLWKHSKMSFCNVHNLLFGMQFQCKMLQGRIQPNTSYRRVNGNDQDRQTRAFFGCLSYL